MGVSGRVFKIQRHSLHDGPGIRTTVFFKGCELRCAWCFNPESHHAYPEVLFYKERCVSCGACAETCSSGAIDLSSFSDRIDRLRCTSCMECAEVCIPHALKAYGWDCSSGDILAAVLRDRVFYRDKGGVTLSGGEVLRQAAFAADILRLCKENGINTAIETCGFGSGDALKEILRYTDLTLFDLKCMDDDMHRRFTGVSNKVILENVRIADRLSRELRICIPVIPSYNATAENMEATARFISSELKSVRLVQLHPYSQGGVSKYARLGRLYAPGDIKPPDDETLDPFRSIFASYGIDTQIGG